MQRRNFLTKGAAAGTTAWLPATVVHAQPQAVSWRLQSSYPKSMDVLYGASTMLSKRVSQLTNGRFEIRVYSAGELLAPQRVLEGVQDGTVEAGHTAGHYHAEQNKVHAFDSALPFGLNVREQNAWIHYGGGMKLLREFYGKLNVVNFPSVNTGTQTGGWFRQPVDSVADLKGLRVAMHGIGAEVFSALGASPQTLPASDVYPSLAKGDLDATEAMGPHDDEKLGLFRVAKNYYAPGFLDASSNASFFVNMDRHLALPKSFQNALDVATHEVSLLGTARYDMLNAVAVRRLVAKGAVLRTFPLDLLQAAYKVTEDMLDAESSRNPDFRKILESWRPFRENQAHWSRLSQLPLSDLAPHLVPRR